MEVLTKKNRQYWKLPDNFQLMLLAKSGRGKGLAEEYLIEEWRKKTDGVVIILVDPKDEAEFTFVQYKANKKFKSSNYQLKQLKKDGMFPESHTCKVYHPFSFNIPKGFLPDINFFTIPIKSLNKEDWSILTESSWDSESIKLMLRVGEDLERNKGMFAFLHEIERLTEGKKLKRKRIYDKKNWYLRSGGGTAKDVSQVGNLLSPFKKDYFITDDLSDKHLNWKEILSDNQNYHIFLSMFLSEGTRKKMKGFLAVYLLNKIIENRKYLKKRLLLVIPEIKAMCPKNPQGYRFFLASALSEALVTIRSKGKGMCSISDTQSWLDTDDRIKASINMTLIGSLSAKDQEVLCKGLSYGKEERELLKSMTHQFCTFFEYEQEDEGTFRIFNPRHMHAEPDYNWIEMYKEHFPDKMKRYDDLIKEKFDDVCRLLLYRMPSVFCIILNSIFVFPHLFFLWRW